MAGGDFDKRSIAIGFSHCWQRQNQISGKFKEASSRTTKKCISLSIKAVSQIHIDLRA